MEVMVMSLSTQSSRHSMSAGSQDGKRDLRRAWASLALLLGSIIAAVWIMNSVTWDLSFWASYLVLVAWVVVVLLFAAGAILFGRRAMREGEDAGRTPVVLGYAIGGLSLVWAVIPIIGHLAGFE
jgi:FtsH-binding integral membrane protein